MHPACDAVLPSSPSPCWPLFPLPHGPGGTYVAGGQLVVNSGGTITAGGLVVKDGALTVMTGGIVVDDGGAQISTKSTTLPAVEIRASTTSYASTLVSVSTGTERAPVSCHLAVSRRSVPRPSPCVPQGMAPLPPPTAACVN
jgi:hypothetical protein